MPYAPLPAGGFGADDYDVQANYQQEYGLQSKAFRVQGYRDGGEHWNEGGPGSTATFVAPLSPRGGASADRMPPGLDAGAVSWSNHA